MLRGSGTVELGEKEAAVSHWTRRHFLQRTSTRSPKDSWEVRDVVPKCRSKVSPAALPIVSLENGESRGQLERTSL